MDGVGARTWLFGAGLLLLTGCGQAAAGASPPPRPQGTGSPAAVSPAQPTPSPPAGFLAVDLNFVSDSWGWALGAAPCPGGPQCAAILHTTDSGATWGSIPAPHAMVQNGNGRIDCLHSATCVGSLRFGAGTAGYAYGPALFHTLDGGQTWEAEPGSLPILDLEYAGRAVFRLLGYGQTGDCFGGCRLQRASATGATWQDSGPVIQTAGAQIIPEGSQRIYVLGLANPAGGAQNKKAIIYMSADGGSTWHARGDPCPGDSFTVGAATAPTRHLVVLCQSLPSGGDLLLRSDDAGQSFGSPVSVPIGYALTAGSAMTIAGLDASSGRNVETSIDGGAHWRLTHSCAGGPYPQNEALALGYQDDTTAHLICPQITVWRSRDGGATWSGSTV